MKEYSRDCPICKNQIIYKKYKFFWKAIKNNSKCRKCFYKSRIGHITSDETKMKISQANKISLLGNIPCNKGKPMTKVQREKLSNVHKGKIMSEETKKKHRILRLKRLEKYKIPLNEDAGAREFFNNWNIKYNTNFKPKTFWDLGYIADGYDENIHTWIEFDPPHHFYINGKLKPKDIKRQNNIINHFKSIGKPLNKFIRIKSTKTGEVIQINEIGKDI